VIKKINVTNTEIFTAEIIQCLGLPSKSSSLGIMGEGVGGEPSERRWTKH
jgi:hypothetical protein